jgi:hypothetical protein
MKAQIKNRPIKSYSKKLSKYSHEDAKFIRGAYRYGKFHLALMRMLGDRQFDELVHRYTELQKTAEAQRELLEQYKRALEGLTDPREVMAHPACRVGKVLKIVE